MENATRKKIHRPAHGIVKSVRFAEIHCVGQERTPCLVPWTAPWAIAGMGFANTRQEKTWAAVLRTVIAVTDTATLRQRQR